MNTSISENDGFSNVFGRLSTLALTGLMVLLLMTFPLSINVDDQGGRVGPSLALADDDDERWRYRRIAEEATYEQQVNKEQQRT